MGAAAVTATNIRLAETSPKATAERKLVDSFGRMHSYLRVSLTDKCNMNCTYCLPPQVGNKNEKEDPQYLTDEELLRVVALFVRLGVRKIRLTGGEPTTRRNFGGILDGLREINASASQPLSIGMTTNGVRLPRFLPQLSSAGVRYINVSLDTLDPALFPLLTGSPVAWHSRVMEGLRAVAAQEDTFVLKVNAVLMRGINDREIGKFLDLTEYLPVELRFIEFMPFDKNKWSERKMVSQAEILANVKQHLAQRGDGTRILRLPPDSPHDVARLWQVPGWRGRLGIISSMTDAFCGGCNRLRLTSDGEVRNCLFGETGWSLRDAMRSGATDDALVEVIADAVARKHARLGGKKDMHELKERAEHGLTMRRLGG